MSYITDTNIFKRQAHNPSFGALKRQLPKSTANKLIDFYVPANKYFPTPEMYEDLHSNLGDALTYYPDQNEPLVEILSQLVDIESDCLVLANGSTELITWIDRLFLSNMLFTSVPTFGRWTDQPVESGKKVQVYQRLEKNNFQIDIDEFAIQAIKQRADVVVLCNPNNPTGAYLAHDKMIALLEKLSSVELIVVDESFIDFVDSPLPTSIQQAATKMHNVIVIKSLGKCFGLHGARIGYAAANPVLAKRIRQALPPWNINGIAELVLRLLGDHWDAFEKSRKQIIADRDYLLQQLQTIPELTVFPSQTNFVYTKMPDSISGIELRNYLARHYGFIIRECANKLGATSQFCRIAATPRLSTDKLISAINEGILHLGQNDELITKRKQAQSTIFQSYKDYGISDVSEHIQTNKVSDDIIHNVS